jgi:hypothetical protein
LRSFAAIFHRERLIADQQTLEKKHRERSLQKLNREQLVGTTEDAGETTPRYEFAD